MHLTLDSAESLASAVSALAGAALKGKGSESRMESALLMQADAEDNLIRLTAIDPNSHQYQLAVHAKVHKSGQCMIAPQHFQRTLGRIGKQRLDLQLTKNTIYLERGGANRYEFVTYQGDPDLFPRVAELPPMLAQVDGSALNDALTGCLKCVMKDEQAIVFMHTDELLHVLTSDYISSASSFQTKDPPSQAYAFTAVAHSLNGTKTPNWAGPVGIHVADDGRRVAFSSGENHLMVFAAQPDESEGRLGAQAQDILSLLALVEHHSYVVKRRTLLEELSIIASNEQTCQLRITGKADKFLTITAINKGISKSQLRIPIEGDTIGNCPPVVMSTELLLRLARSVDGEECRVDYVSWDDGETLNVRLSNDKNPEGRRGLSVTVQDPVYNKDDGFQSTGFKED